MAAREDPGGGPRAVSVLLEGEAPHLADVRLVAVSGPDLERGRLLVEALAELVIKRGPAARAPLLVLLRKEGSLRRRNVR